MICSGCASSISDDCRYCPQCGSPTPLADVESNAPVEDSYIPSEDSDQSFALTRYNGPASLTELLPKSLQSALTQANLCRIRRQWEEAIECCIAVLRAQPGNQTAHSLLGDIYRDQGKLDDAIQWYRMAVDLGPNPTDESKLRHLERERARANRLQDTRFGGQGLSVALNADGSVTAGTTNLMGISPRRWLTGMTLLSVAFATLMIALLIGLKISKRAPQVASNSPASNTYTLPTPSAAASQSALPSPVYTPPVSAPALADNSATSRIGKGMRADETTIGDLPPMPQTSKSAMERKTEAATGSLPPAPVLAVKPLPSPPTETTETPRAERSAAPTQNSLPLADGMRLAQTYRDPSSHAVSLLITSTIASSSALNAKTRENMVRNVYRAARAYFAANTDTSRLSVYVQAGMEVSPQALTLLLAEIDRTTAELHQPDSDPLKRLESGLLSLRVANETPADTHPASSDTLILSSGGA